MNATDISNHEKNCLYDEGYDAASKGDSFMTCPYEKEDDPKRKWIMFIIHDFLEFPNGQKE